MPTRRTTRSAYFRFNEQNLRFYLWSIAGVVVGYTCCAIMAVGGLKIKRLDDRMYISVIFVPVRMSLSMLLLLLLLLVLALPPPPPISHSVSLSFPFLFFLAHVCHQDQHLLANTLALQLAWKGRKTQV